MVLKRASSSSSSSTEAGPSAHEELHRMVDLLSDDECAHLLSAVSDIAAGERFWEEDSGLFYNEYVKLRYFRVGRNTPTAPSIDHSAFVPMFVTKTYPDATQVPLPRPVPFAARLDETLAQRRSRRNYCDTPLDLNQLSALLHFGAGVTATVPAYGFECLPLRTFPTHGGLQSPELYLSVRAVAGLAAGIYHYEPRAHSLELLHDGDFGERLREFAFGEKHVAQAAVVLLLTGVYDRLRWKYGERAYRFLCMDVGFVSENLCLVSEGLGLGACPVSGFAQDAAEKLLGVDGKRELTVLMLTVGALDRPTPRSE
jgi:SagB-type dehydrogenase family enzyme